MIRPIRSHINQYIADIQTRSFGGSAIKLWRQKEQSNIYSVLTLIAQDLVFAPSSQAFVETLFSVCGMLTVGRRNRMDKSLNMRAGWKWTMIHLLAWACLITSAAEVAWPALHRCAYNSCNTVQCVQMPINYRSPASWTLCFYGDLPLTYIMFKYVYLLGNKLTDR